MSSQKKSSTKVRAKKAAPTGQRQFSNLSKSTQAASMKANNRPPRQSIAVVALTHDQVSKGNVRQIMRTGPRSELYSSIPATASLEFQLMHRIRLNPLSKGTFKWLPTIAQNFESYKFHKLRIRFENRCSTATPGSIIMSPSYDASDSSAQAASESLLFQNKGTKDFSVWKSGVLEVHCPSLNRLYKSHTCMSDERYNLTAQDKKTIDPGQIFICLDGVPPATFTGKIFIDYDIEFFEPHAPTEPINQGGEAIVNNAILPNGNVRPFTALPSVVKSEISPIMKSIVDLVADGTFVTPSVGNPSAIIGQFLKDYSGIMVSDFDGTGVSSANLAYEVTTDPTNSWLGTGTPINLIPATFNMISTGTTQMRGLYQMVATAGQYLKMKSPSAATLSGGTIRLAGAGITF